MTQPTPIRRQPLAGAVGAGRALGGRMPPPAVLDLRGSVRRLARTLRADRRLIAATAGTARHSLVLDHAMRPLFAYLRAVVVPTGVFAATEDFGSHGLSDRITRAASELAAAVLSQGDYGVGGFAPDLAARPRRTSGTQVESDVTPFGDLLRGHSGSD